MSTLEITEPGTLSRILDTLDRVPWQDESTRAHIWHALETSATLPPDDSARRRAWETVRYLAGFPSVPGVQTPIYAAMTQGAADEETPSFDALMAALNFASGWAA